MDAIDLPCHSVRDFLDLTAAVREAKTRDPLRTIEDCLLDLLAMVEPQDSHLAESHETAI